MPEPMSSLREELARAVDQLTTAGVVDARGEADAVWRAITDSSPALRLLANGREPVRERTVEEREWVRRFRMAVERRSRSEPMAYACGTVGFRRLTLRSDARALIPRPESEGLVELALGLHPRGDVLDLGTGSGCLALALADEGEYGRVVGIDVSAEAIALARENGTSTGLAVDWRLGSWCAPVAGQRFEIVVCNPPYLTTGEVGLVDPSVGRWEPALALDGGEDGLRATKMILAGVLDVLSPGGHLVLEVDARRAQATAALLRLGVGVGGVGGWEAITITEDLFGRSRYLTARRGEHGS